MPLLSGKPVSFWVDTGPRTTFPPLDQDQSVDVAVVGGGIVGVSTAFLLKKAGFSVALIESRRVGAQVTGASTAKLTSQHGLIYTDLVEKFGEESARTYAAANEAAIARIFSIADELDIECDLERTAAYVYAESEQGLQRLEAEARVAVRLGLPASFVQEVSLPFPVAGAVRFEHQARFHPVRYVAALSAAIPGDGSHVFEATRALDVNEGTPCQVSCDRGTVRAQQVIIATNLPILDRGGFFTKAYPRRHAMLACRTTETASPDGMFLSSGESTYSFRRHRLDNETFLIAVGPSFKTGHEDTVREFEKLENFVRERFSVESVEYRWGNQDYYSMDRVPYVGKLTPFSKRVFTATGFSAWGLTNGTAAAIMLCDRITGKENSWADLYNATRINPRVSGSRFIQENLHVGREWVADRFAQPKARLSELSPGQAAIVDVKGKKAAAYRDEEGRLSAVSAVCTHLGCLVTWNDAEKSWDCPCHGSRFSVDGAVLQGPAVHGLQTIPTE